ncbi:MAG TPA: hypothetical protein PKA60_00110 [Candidatus Paceibacterota bacterium]|nr:hypothetical protein [Candidatus Paceibacterota bacterium]
MNDKINEKKTNNNFLQDVIPPRQKRSIRDIPVPPRKRSSLQSNMPSNRSAEKPAKTVVQDLRPKPVPPSYDSSFDNDEFDATTKFHDNNFTKSGGRKKWLIASSAVIIVAFIFFGISFFHSADVIIESKVVEATINKVIPIADVTRNSNQNVLSYNIIELSREASKEIRAEKEEFVQSKSSGIITVINEYSETPQTLIRNTRFESPNGLIYRIQDSITVPGYKTVNGQKIPGEIDTQVFADVAGDKYNIDLVNFTIPGFKGQAPYELFYAKSKSPMSGGFDGVRKVVSEEDLAKAKSDLQEELTKNLQAELRNQIPNDFMFAGNNSFVFGAIQQKNSTNGQSVILSLNGTISSKIFNKISLSNEIARNTIIDYKPEHNVLIKDIEEVNPRITTSDNGSIIGTNEILEINSKLTFVWQIDTEQVKKSLAGVGKKDFGGILAEFSGVVKGQSKIFPFWKNSFPDDVKRINIQII